MATFVLVHGGWHGGWCWQRVAPLLRAAGHEVFAPTLTGMGERAHLLSPDLTLDTHVEDVAAVLRFEDLHDVVLVGHSYGGMVITGVAEAEAERLSRLVYLDAVVPLDGQNYLDTLPEGFLDFTGALWANETYRVRAPMAQFLNITEPGDVAWVEERLTDHPSATAAQPVKLTNPDAAALRKVFVVCPGGMYAPFYRRAKVDGWPTLKLLTGHEAMITAPSSVAEVLVEALAV